MNNSMFGTNGLIPERIFTTRLILAVRIKNVQFCRPSFPGRLAGNVMADEDI